MIHILRVFSLLPCKLPALNLISQTRLDGHPKMGGTPVLVWLMPEVSSLSVCHGEETISALCSLMARKMKPPFLGELETYRESSCNNDCISAAPILLAWHVVQAVGFFK